MINPSLADFVAEEDLEQAQTDINDNLGALEDALLQLEKAPEDNELVNSVFRAMHSIKGIAGMFGLEQIASLTHHIEDVYDLIRKGQQELNRDLISLTLTARDQIDDLTNNDGANTEQEEIQRVVISFKSMLDTAEGAEPEQALAEEEAEPLPESLYWVRFRFDPNHKTFDFATNPVTYLKALKTLGECRIVPQVNAIPTLAQLDPSVCYLYWEVALLTSANESTIRDEFIFIEDELMELEITKSPEDPVNGDWRIGRILTDRGDISPVELEKSINKQDGSQSVTPVGTLLVQEGNVAPCQVKTALASQSLVKEKCAKKHQEHEVTSIRVPSSKLDQLVNQVGELVIAQARLKQNVDTMQGAYALHGVAEEITLLTENLRDSTMSIRMLPIGSLFKKFNRLVRDISQDLGKEIQLVTEGSETELDKTVIEHINDPLVHLIRNCIDHGIEVPEVRISAGKDAAGTVKLSAIHSGADVVIRVEDDGKGLDPVALRAKAEEKGLIKADDVLSDKEIFALIFAPGFSTKAQVTNLSGRGVGMDVVKRHIESLRGTVQIDSKPGQGSIVTLKLPLTLAIIDGFLIRSGGERYVIPLSTVRECVRLTQQEIDQAHGEQIINIRNEIVPYVRLRELFKLGDIQPVKEQVVITETDADRVGLVVDQVIGQSQVVIKSLGAVFRNVPFFSGATILGDGGVVPILDISKIIETVMD